MKNKNLPLVSVVMTAYNAGKFVLQAVRSIQNQTYSHWELIVVNDGSTDDTGSILKSLAKCDKRIVLISYAQNKGASYASNVGLSKARGAYIARMDADDIAMRDRLTKQLQYLERNEDVVAVGGQCELIDKKGKKFGSKNFPLTHEEIYPVLYQYNPIQHPTLMVNTFLLGKRRIRYNSTVALAHDLELLFYLAQYGKLANLPDSILQYRIHNDSLSLSNPKKTFRDTLLARMRAVLIYGYVPTVKSRLIHFSQRVVVSILPSIIIYPLFHLIRTRQVSDIRVLVAHTGMYTVKQMQLRFGGVVAAMAAWVTR